MVPQTGTAESIAPPALSVPLRVECSRPACGSATTAGQRVEDAVSLVDTPPTGLGRDNDCDSG